MKHKKSSKSHQEKFMSIVTALTSAKYWNPDISEIAKACGVSWNYTHKTVNKLRNADKIDHQIGVRLDGVK